MKAARLTCAERVCTGGQLPGTKPLINPLQNGNLHGMLCFLRKKSQFIALLKDN